MNKQEIIARLAELMQQDELEPVRAEVEELGRRYKEAEGEATEEENLRFLQLWAQFEAATAEQAEPTQEPATEEEPAVADAATDEDATPGTATDAPENAAEGSLEVPTDENVEETAVSNEEETNPVAGTGGEPTEEPTEPEAEAAPEDKTVVTEAQQKEEPIATEETATEETRELPDNKKDIITRLEALLKEPDGEALRAEVEELENQYQKVADEQEDAQKKAFVTGGGNADDFEAPVEAEDNRFKELQNIFSERQEKSDAAQAASEQTNLETKRRIVEELKNLVNSVVTGDRMSAAFEKFNSLRDQWRNTGNVPGRYYKQLQSDFSHQIDMFFYNVEIYRALKIHDFNKNLEAKKELIGKVKALLEEKSIKKIEDHIRLLQTEWSEIGPVKEEDWKELRNDFWNTVNAVYDKVHAHYDTIRETQQKNLEAKQALVDVVTNINQLELKHHKKWQEKTDEILKAQQEWKKIGYGPRKENDQVWKAFRAACNEFFKKKKEFYGTLRDDYKAAREEKEMLIREAEALKVSTDWRDTADAFKHLQQRWKDTGTAGPKDEQRLWKDFRTACDFFFNAKKEFYATIDDRHANNLKEKETILSEMEGYQLTGDNDKDLAQFKEFANRWRAVGHIPKDKIEDTNGRYSKAMDALYGALKMDSKKKAMVRFTNKVESMENADQGDRMLEKEYRHVHDQVSKLRETIELYENNLSFFGPSKGAEALKQDVLKKIDKAKEELVLWEEKLKMLPKPARPQFSNNRGGGRRDDRGRGGNNRGGGRR